MNTSTITLTISHEGELPKGLLAAIEAKAYDWTMAHGVACGAVVAEAMEKTQVARPMTEVEALVIADHYGRRWQAPDEEGISFEVSNFFGFLSSLLRGQASPVVRLPVKEMRDE